MGNRETGCGMLSSGPNKAHALITAVVTYSRPTQNQAYQRSRTEGGGTLEALPLAEQFGS